MKTIVTGGAGFIGSSVVRHLVQCEGADVTVIDKMTYASSREALASVSGSDRYRLHVNDICDAPAMARIIADTAPDAIIHLAAETHVDRSIDGARAFIDTNISGTFTLLETVRQYWEKLETSRQETFRFLQVSTDEVYGSLGPEGAFSETTAFDPSSPYSASKAAADHLVTAWHRTYGLPTIISNCSNNYGPFQFPEKLIPLMILNALEGTPLPVYGDGQQVRDWLHVDDHVAALVTLLKKGRPGQTYNVGGNGERTNIDVVKTICATLDALRPKEAPHTRLISHVQDRPGHDLRYAIDATKICSELGWAPKHSFEAGLTDTIQWYLANEAWWRPLREQVYAGDRLGQLPSRQRPASTAKSQKVSS